MSMTKELEAQLMKGVETLEPYIDLKRIENPRVYIAGAITGRSFEEYRKQFAQAEEWFNLNGIETVNPVTLPHDHDKSWESYMREGLRALLDCSAVYMLKGWEASKGATLERLVAQSVGIKIIYQ